jgi:hypothetical protein
MKRVAFGGFYANLYYDLAHQYFESILNVIFVPPPEVGGSTRPRTRWL